MELQSLIIFLVIGAVAGWLADLLMRGGGFGGWLFGVRASLSVDWSTG